MSKQLWRGGALLAPMPPVMVTCGSMEKPNIITIAWTGITNTIPPKTYISVRPKRHSYPLIRESGEFVINLATAPLTTAASTPGRRSINLKNAVSPPSPPMRSPALSSHSRPYRSNAA